MEERLSFDRREDGGEELRRLLVPEGPGRLVAALQALPVAKDRDGPLAVADRLPLPGAGELGLGGGDRLVALAESGEEGGGEDVAGGGAGTIFRGVHRAFSCVHSRGRRRLMLCRPRFRGREERPPGWEESTMRWRKSSER